MRKEYDLSKMKCRPNPYAKRLRRQMGPLWPVQLLAERIAQEISPRRIILFGSHAHGKPGPDSDVDLLVITDRPEGNDASLQLRRKVEYSFPLDLIVCDAGRLARRIEAGDYFLQDAVQFGKVLYERPNG
jgi:predicted nucleotidyltransferase